MKTLLEIAFDKHKDWIYIVKSFGCNPGTAEDIVQEMYIQIHLDIWTDSCRCSGPALPQDPGHN